MSDFSQGPGWWQASDGKWYSPEQAPGGGFAAAPASGDPYAQSAVGTAQPMADPYAQPGAGYAQPGAAVAPAWGGSAPAYGGGGGPVGKVRKPIIVLLLSIITLGIYSLYWEYATFKEMKDYSNQGIGGGLALVIGLILSIVLVFLMPAEVGGLYSREGQQPPVSGKTGFWVLLPILGGFIWLWKSQGRLNDFWIAHGATA